MAQASLLTDILRILTPEEISELTSQSTSNSRLALTDLLDMVEEGESVSFNTEASEVDGAKILPFKKKEEVTEEKEVYHCGKNTQEYIEHHFHKITLGETAKNERGDTVVTSVFILKEKERFKYVQAKLKSREVLDLYRKNSNVDIEQEKILKDDLSKSSRSGVLINKKQY